MINILSLEVLPAEKERGKKGTTASCTVKNKVKNAVVVKPEVEYNCHVKLGLIGSKTYAKKITKVFEKDYDCSNVIVKQEGNYYRIYVDFKDKASAKTACKDMIHRKYIVNYYFYVK